MIMGNNRRRSLQFGGIGGVGSFVPNYAGTIGATTGSYSLPSAAAPSYDEDFSIGSGNAGLRPAGTAPFVAPFFSNTMSEPTASQLAALDPGIEAQLHPAASEDDIPASDTSEMSNLTRSPGGGFVTPGGGGIDASSFDKYTPLGLQGIQPNMGYPALGLTGSGRIPSQPGDTVGQSTIGANLDALEGMKETMGYPAVGMSPFSEAFSSAGGSSLNPKTQSALDALQSALQAKGFNTHDPISGFRSYEDQSEIYADALAKQQGRALPYPSRGPVTGVAAKPGTSPHEFGAAFDTGYSGDELSYADEIAPSLGLSTVRGDPGHFQLSGYTGPGSVTPGTGNNLWAKNVSLTPQGGGVTGGLPIGAAGIRPPIETVSGSGRGFASGGAPKPLPPAVAFRIKNFPDYKEGEMIPSGYAERYVASTRDPMLMSPPNNPPKFGYSEGEAQGTSNIGTKDTATPPGWAPGTTPQTHAPVSVEAMNQPPVQSASAPQGGGQFYYMKGGRVHRKSFDAGGAATPDSAPPPSGGIYADIPSDRRETTPQQRMDFTRRWMAENRPGAPVEPALGVAASEGLHSPGAGGSTVDVENGKPFSWGTYQMNVRDGMGAAARAAGIDPADPRQWQHADAYALSQMYPERGGLNLAPWKGDAYVRGRGANMPAPDAQEAQATTPAYGGGFTLPASGAPPPQQQGPPRPDLSGFLLRTGAGMMASRSPWFGTAMGEGLLAGSNYLQQSQELARQWNLSQAQINNLSAEAREHDADAGLKARQLRIQAMQAGIQISAMKAAGYDIDPSQYGLPSIGGGEGGPTAGPGGPSTGVQPIQPIKPVMGASGAPGAAGAPAGGPTQTAQAQPSQGASDYATAYQGLEREYKRLQALEIAKLVQPGAASTVRQQMIEAQKSGRIVTPDGRQILNPDFVQQEASAESTKEQFKKGAAQLDEEDEEAVDGRYSMNVQEQRLNALKQIMQRWQPGAWKEHLADISNVLRTMGFNVRDPSDAYEFLKNTTGEVFDALKQQKGAARNVEITGLQKANPSTDIPAQANAAIINQMLGVIHERQDYYKAYSDWRKTAEGSSARNPLSFSNKWMTDHPVQRYVDKEDLNFPYLGQSIPKVKQDGKLYMLPDGRIGRYNGQTRGFDIQQGP